jgi:hypothetical protein
MTRRTRDEEEEVERFRRAAEETLRQLEWCSGYLYRIRKPDIARTIDANRRFIQSRLGEEQPSRRR